MPLYFLVLAIAWGWDQHDFFSMCAQMLFDCNDPDGGMLQRSLLIISVAPFLRRLKFTLVISVQFGCFFFLLVIFSEKGT